MKKVFNKATELKGLSNGGDYDFYQHWMTSFTMKTLKQ